MLLYSTHLIIMSGHFISVEDKVQDKQDRFQPLWIL